MAGKISQEEASRLLADVPPDKSFYLTSGSYIRNIHELLDALEHMTDDTFTFHVNDEKHDFLGWLRDVVGDKDILPAVEKATKRTKLIKVLCKRIEQLDATMHDSPFEERSIVKKAPKKQTKKEKNAVPVVHEEQHTANHTHEQRKNRFDLNTYILGVLVGLLIGLIIGKLI